MSGSQGGSSAVELEFLSIPDIAKVLKKQESLSDAPDEVANELAARLHRPLQSAFQEAARLAFEALLASSSGQRRRTHGELQERLQTHLHNIKQVRTFHSSIFLQFSFLLFAGRKSLATFYVPGHPTAAGAPSFEDHRFRFGQRTGPLHSAGFKCYHGYQRSDPGSNVLLLNGKVIFLTNTIFFQVRQKLIGELDQNFRAPLLAVHKAAQSGTSVEEFLALAEAAMISCDIVLRRPDKKKDKTLLSSQRHSLIDQLSSASEAALLLHVAVLLLFHTCTQTLLMASGRFVPQIITFLQPHLPTEIYDTLTALQGLVIQELTAKGDDEQQAVIRQQMEELMPRVREAAVTFKKSNAPVDE